MWAAGVYLCTWVERGLVGAGYFLVFILLVHIHLKTQPRWMSLREGKLSVNCLRRGWIRERLCGVKKS